MKAYAGWLFLNQTSGLREEDIKTKIYVCKKMFSYETWVTKDCSL